MSFLLTMMMALNLLTFAAFGWDKLRACSGGWRLREDTLLILAAMGGTIGALGGRALFRHKTRKQPFGRILMTIALLQAFAVASGIGWVFAG